MQTTSDVAASMGKVVSMILFVIDKTYTSEQIVSDYHKKCPRKTVRSFKRHTFHPLNQRRPIRRDGLGIIPFFPRKRLHELREERVLPIVQHNAQLMPHAVN